MPAMPRQAAYTPVSSTLLLNVYATEIERVVSGTFGNLTNTGRPRVLATRTSIQPVVNFTDTTIPFQTTITDPRAMWNASVPDILTIKDAGDWIFFGQERWPPTPTGIRSGKIMKNGTNPATPGVVQSSNNVAAINDGEGPTMGLFAAFRCAVNDLIRLNAWQNSGVTQNLATDNGSTFLGGIWIGP